MEVGWLYRGATLDLCQWGWGLGGSTVVLIATHDDGEGMWCSKNVLKLKLKELYQVLCAKIHVAIRTHDSKKSQNLIIGVLK